MNHLMKLEGHRARIEYDPELDMFRGEILGLNGGADFFGQTPDELREEFRKSLAVFLEVCAEKRISPYRQYSGRFNLRVPSDLHQEIAVRASAEGKSLNQWITETLAQAV